MTEKRQASWTEGSWIAVSLIEVSWIDKLTVVSLIELCLIRKDKFHS